MSNADKGWLGFSVSQWRLFTLVLVVGLALIAFQLFRQQGISDTAALYVGLPFMLALGMSLSSKTKSTVGATMKGLTIALLLSVPVFMEGFICVLFASPILYSVAAIAAWLIDEVKKAADQRSKLRLSVTATLLFAASLEGTSYEIFSFDDHYRVAYSNTVSADIETVRAGLAAPSFADSHRPLFLSVFPYPVSVSGGGLQVGDTHRLEFSYKKWFVANEHRGNTIFRVTHATDNTIRFDIPHDSSYLSHYLTWQLSEVSLEPVDDSTTKITWALSFKRNLDLAWYFGPLQRYAAWLAAKVLVSNVAS
ncbi:MAG: hypothetical protein AAF404_06190 [Pseudomonadota bacterium]